MKRRVDRFHACYRPTGSWRLLKTGSEASRQRTVFIEHAGGTGNACDVRRKLVETLHATSLHTQQLAVSVTRDLLAPALARVAAQEAAAVAVAAASATT